MISKAKPRGFMSEVTNRDRWRFCCPYHHPSHKLQTKKKSTSGLCPNKRSQTISTIPFPKMATKHDEFEGKNSNNNLGQDSRSIERYRITKQSTISIHK